MKRTIIGIVCILLVPCILFGLMPLINTYSSEKTTIIRVAQDIAAGSEITDSDVIEVKVAASGLPDSVIKKRIDVVGKYASVDLRMDDYILPTKLSETGDSADSQFRNLKDGEKAISIALSSLERGLSGNLQKGDIVSVIYSGANTEAVIPKELQYVKVITTTTSEGVNKGESAVEGEIASTATLLVNDIQASLLAGYQNTGNLHLALVHRGDNGQKYLDAQANLLKSKAGDSNE